jgi:hypothetical protein
MNNQATDIEILNETVKYIIKEDYQSLDRNLEQMLCLLKKTGADECWHKKSTFYSHLYSVYCILKVWDQPQDICRCGLFHSAYSNSYVNLNIIDDRNIVSSLAGEQAEDLIYKFCRVNRKDLIFDNILYNKNIMESYIIPEEGLTMKNIKDGSDIHLSKTLILKFIILTIADFSEQFHSWLDELFENEDGNFLLNGRRNDYLWPGEMKPSLFMAGLSKLSYLLKVNENEEITLPPIFNNCSVILSNEDEKRARDLYWEVTTNKRSKEHHEEALNDLKKAIQLNPFIGEPHLLISQIYLQKENYDEGIKSAMEGIKILSQWGTQWDKRVNWKALIAWGRVLIISGENKSYPKSTLGMINLGKVNIK